MFTGMIADGAAISKKTDIKIPKERKKILVIDGSNPNSTYRSEKFLGEKHEMCKVISQEALNNIMKLKKRGLHYFDLIFLEPYFTHVPRYSYEETNEATQTGWFLYKDLLITLKIPIIIWTYPTEQYQYGPGNFPGRKWGDNVFIHHKSGDDDSMLQIVEKYCS